ncbi:MAG: helix-turn-helix transcriptional regulator [Mesorhizobium sp.]|nr:MAG: helix-turn-helix transcriptional regulator [Mesorhizobium sp.]RWL95359.1 MAG: helix-turn-helix transcriptional regulator [Mesorhizobium sp.]
MNEDEVGYALRLMHEAVLLPDFWPEALPQVAEMCGSDLALVCAVGEHGFAAIPSAGQEEVIGEFVRQGWDKRNPRMHNGLRLTSQGFRGLITNQMMPPTLLARDPFEQEFAPKVGLDFEAAQIVSSHAGAHFILAFNRGRTRGPYSQAELASLNRLVEGFSSACSFALRLKLATASQILDTLGDHREALALLSATGRVLHMSPAFAQLLGTRLDVRAGHIRAIDPVDDGELRALVSRSCGGALAPASKIEPAVLTRHAGAPIVIHCLPIAGAARDFLGLARAVLVIDDLKPIPPKGREQTMRKAYGLTQSEARLATRIGTGESVRDAADAEGIAFETARTRLKSVYDKTNTSRRSELALLVARMSNR